MQKLSKTMEIVECSVCKSKHDAESDTFISIQGNVMIGMHGGVIGNNFAEDGTLKSITCLCRNSECVNQGLFDLIREAMFK